jgi:uncharacterized repeat protein (TIGR01451 family)
MAPRLPGYLTLLVAAALCTVVGPPARAAGPQLHVSILVDRVTARPGDVIHYEVRVENLGDSDAGVVRVTSHYPVGTTAATQSCPNGTIEPDGDLCLHPDLPTPGLGDSAHQVNNSRSGLAPGAAFSVLFAVRVNADTALGSHLPDHAHASSETAAEVTSAPVDTLVAGTIPDAVFGRSALAASGQTVTDSWDSSAGTLAATQQPTDGDVASNGDIDLSGGSLINGDATPGPGKAVFLTNTARVTGSTAPATALVALNEIDAAPYADNNDNHRICRQQGSCDGTSYDSATKTLVVGGSAVLPTGAYYLCRLDVSGVLTIAGNVTLWFGAPAACGGRTDPVLFESTGVVSIASGHTRDFQLRVQGSTADPTAIRITSSSSLTGVVYAPHSTFLIEGHGALLGNATADAAALSGQAVVHIDRALDH